MSRKRLVIVGGDAAGMSAASVARRRSKDLHIAVFEKGAFTSYAACGIPYFAGQLIKDAGELVARSPEEFRKQNIEVRTLHEVTELDLAGTRVRVREVGTGQERWESYDQLLIATGAVPIIPPVEGIGAENVRSISGLQSGIDLRRLLDDKKPQKTVVVGGGYIGVEMAEALRLRGCEVALVEKEAQLMPTLDADMAALVAGQFIAQGIELHLGEALVGIETDANGCAHAVVTSRGRIETELVVLGLGIRPNAALAVQAGITLGDRGSIQVDAHLRTSVDSVWAAGDCAGSLHLVSGQPTWVALGTVANKHGRVAGINLSGGDASFPGVLGTAITKFFDAEIARTGLQERELAALGIAHATAKIDAGTRAHYYPGSTAITVKLHAEAGSGRLLGAQIVGGPGSGKRIDVAAVALHARLGVAEMIDLDLAYAPPFSPVWDPVQTAARVLEGTLSQRNPAAPAPMKV